MLPAIILNKEAISKHSIFSFPCFKKSIYNSLFIYKIQFHYWFTYGESFCTIWFYGSLSKLQPTHLKKYRICGTAILIWSRSIKTYYT